jgi:chemotaxis protein methyltransferase WspC
MIYQQIAEFLSQKIGLQADSIGRPTVERALHARLAACAMDEQTYWHHLRESSAETQDLIEAMVVSETWFFRDRTSFQALTTEVLAKSEPTSSGRMLRFLSIPCATGEEPFSLAMALLDDGRSAESFQIDAWDVSQRALAWAEQATYGKNSFRGTDLRYRARHFESVGSDYQVKDQVRRMVRFKQANILAAESLAPDGLYDVIFCRNMLIYFDRPSQQRAVQLLARLLAAKGTVFVGPSEAAPLLGNGFVSSRIPGAFAFRRADVLRPGGKVVAAKQTATPMQRQTTGAQLRSVAETPPAAGSGLPLASVPRLPESHTMNVPDWVGAASQLADAGRLAEAMEVCDRGLAGEQPCAQAYHLKGVLHDALGDGEEAIAHYRKALYLDPHHQDALLQLGAALLKNGDRDAAQQLFNRVARLLAKGDG